MNEKPTPKTCYSRRCVCYEIATDKRREFESISKMARRLEISPSHLNQIVRSRMHTDTHVVAYIEDERKAIEKLHFLQSKKGFRQRDNSNALVSLRIDAKTVIFVTPDKANEEYAELWRKRHEADADRRSRDEFIGANNTLKITKTNK